MKSIFRLLPVAIFMVAAVLTRSQLPEHHPSAVGSNTISPGEPAVLAIIAEREARRLEAVSLRTQAKSAMKKGDFPGAFTLLQQSLSLNPIDGETCMLLAYFYIQNGQSENIIATLGPIVNPPSDTMVSVGSEINTQMIYILALLDRNAWPDAVACYKKSRQCRRMIWFLNGGGPERAWPNPKFSVDTPDYAGLRAYAHLVLGTNAPHFIQKKDQAPFMLGHLRQLLQINPNSFDAAFASGCLYRKLERYADARTAHAYASQVASPAEQKEIDAELKELKSDEDSKKRGLALQASLQAKPK